MANKNNNDEELFKLMTNIKAQIQETQRTLSWTDSNKLHWGTSHANVRKQKAKRKSFSEKVRERFCYLLRNKERKHAAKKRRNEIFSELWETKKCRIQYSVKLSFKSEWERFFPTNKNWGNLLPVDISYKKMLKYFRQ